MRLGALLLALCAAALASDVQFGAKEHMWLERETFTGATMQYAADEQNMVNQVPKLAQCPSTVLGGTNSVCSGGSVGAAAVAMQQGVTSAAARMTAVVQEMLESTTSASNSNSNAPPTNPPASTSPGTGTTTPGTGTTPGTTAISPGTTTVSPGRTTVSPGRTTVSPGTTTPSRTRSSRSTAAPGTVRGSLLQLLVPATQPRTPTRQPGASTAAPGIVGTSPSPPPAASPSTPTQPPPSPGTQPTTAEAQTPRSQGQQPRRPIESSGLFSNEQLWFMYQGNWIRDMNQIITPSFVADMKKAVDEETAEMRAGAAMPEPILLTLLEHVKNNFPVGERTKQALDQIVSSAQQFLTWLKTRTTTALGSLGSFDVSAVRSRDTLTRVLQVMWQSKAAQMSWEVIKNNHNYLSRTNHTEPVQIPGCPVPAHPMFAVSRATAGVYRARDHVDNPKGLPDASAKDPEFDPACTPDFQANLFCDKLSVNRRKQRKVFFDEVEAHISSLFDTVEQYLTCRKNTQDQEHRRLLEANALREFGRAMHAIEDFPSHSNFLELLIGRVLREMGEQSPDAQLLGTVNNAPLASLTPFPWTVSLPKASGEGRFMPLTTGSFGTEDLVNSLVDTLDEMLTRERAPVCETKSNRPIMLGSAMKIALVLFDDVLAEAAVSNPRLQQLSRSFQQKLYQALDSFYDPDKWESEWSSVARVWCSVQEVMGDAADLMKVISPLHQLGKLIRRVTGMRALKIVSEVIRTQQWFNVDWPRIETPLTRDRAVRDHCKRQRRGAVCDSPNIPRNIQDQVIEQGLSNPSHSMINKDHNNSHPLHHLAKAVAMQNVLKMGQMLKAGMDSPEGLGSRLSAAAEKVFVHPDFLPASSCAFKLVKCWVEGQRKNNDGVLPELVTPVRLLKYVLDDAPPVVGRMAGLAAAGGTRFIPLLKEAVALMQLLKIKSFGSLDDMGKTLMALLNSIQSMSGFTQLFEMFKSLANNALSNTQWLEIFLQRHSQSQGVMDRVANKLGEMGQAVSDTAQQAKQAVGETMQEAKQAVGETVQEAKQAVENTVNHVTEQGARAWDRTKNGAEDLKQSVLNWKPFG